MLQLFNFIWHRFRALTIDWCSHEKTAFLMLFKRPSSPVSRDPDSTETVETNRRTHDGRSLSSRKRTDTNGRTAGGSVVPEGNAAGGNVSWMRLFRLFKITKILRTIRIFKVGSTRMLDADAVWGWWCSERRSGLVCGACAEEGRGQVDASWVLFSTHFHCHITAKPAAVCRIVACAPCALPNRTNLNHPSPTSSKCVSVAGADVGRLMTCMTPVGTWSRLPGTNLFDMLTGLSWTLSDDGKLHQMHSSDVSWICWDLFFGSSTYYHFACLLHSYIGGVPWNTILAFDQAKETKVKTSWSFTTKVWAFPS